MLATLDLEFQSCGIQQSTLFHSLRILPRAKSSLPKENQMMKITLRHLLLLFLISVPFPLAHSASTTNSTYYYNQCSPSRCGSSILKFPFGRNPLCRSAYTKITCENNKLYLTDEENKYTKYQLLENLTEEVYSRRSIRVVDTSLFGCGTIPPFQDLALDADNKAQKWYTIGAFSIFSPIYRMGTFFNCTIELDGETLSSLIKAPCLECGPTNNFCYFYTGYPQHIDNCRPFRIAIPAKELTNLTSVGNLRNLLQEGFELQWNGACNSCMLDGVGRCGYIDENMNSSEQYCFCTDQIHKSNCTDGAIIHLDSEEKNPGKKSGKMSTGLIAGVALGAAVGLLCMLYVLHKWKHNKRQRSRLKRKDGQVLKRYLDGETEKPPASIGTFLKKYSLGRPTRFSYRQLKKYTNNFNHKIGQGGFGSVFKGELPNRVIIAVKVLDEGTNQVQTQFLNEILTIGLIHHNHLIRVLGYCFDQSRIALVYEFMVNGSLDKYLHQKEDINNGQPKETSSSAQAVTEHSTLTWAQLHNITIGTAKGLAYLHEDCRSRILHCDIKPHNILLDENFDPRVSDFGLAMALNKEKSHISVTHGIGTPGYAPPEMWLMKIGPMTDKSDVYSLGMVILEMAGQRRNFKIDVSNSSELYFPQWVFAHHVHNAYGDGGGSKWHEYTGEEEEEIAKRMELAGLWCIQFEPSKRPAMRKVVDMLEGNVAIEIPPAPFDANMCSPFPYRIEIDIAPELNSSET